MILSVLINHLLENVPKYTLHTTLIWVDNWAVYIHKEINGEGVSALVAVVLWLRLCGRKDSGSNYQDQVNLSQITDNYRKQLFFTQAMVPVIENVTVCSS